MKVESTNAATWCLAEVFLRACPTAALEVAPLQSALELLVARARGAWPQLEVAEAAFVAHLARHCAGSNPWQKLKNVYVEDLYLAFACASGDAAAQRVFDRDWLKRVEAELRRKPAFATVAEDAIQALRQKLLVPPASGLTRLGDYAGTGPLVAMLRAAAIRTALNLLRAEPSVDQVEVDESTALFTTNPELDFLKVTYRKAFKASFRQAIAELADDRLNVLRLHLVDGLNTEKIGLMYQAHRSTIARWISESRSTLLRRTRYHLALATQVDQRELDSMIRLLRSQLDVSLRSVLQP